MNFVQQEVCWIIVEFEVLCMGYYIYGWWYVLVNISVLGEKVNVICFEIEQILICCEKDIDQEQFECELYIICCCIEKVVIVVQIGGFYFVLLLCWLIIYKGMMLVEQVVEFYFDLKDEWFESVFVIYYQCYFINIFL